MKLHCFSVQISCNNQIIFLELELYFTRLSRYNGHWVVESVHDCSDTNNTIQPDFVMRSSKSLGRWGIRDYWPMEQPLGGLVWASTSVSSNIHAASFPDILYFVLLCWAGSRVDGGITVVTFVHDLNTASLFYEMQPVNVFFCCFKLNRVKYFAAGQSCCFN